MPGTQSQFSELSYSIKPITVDPSSMDQRGYKHVYFTDELSKGQCTSPIWSRYRLALNAGKDYSPSQDVDLVILGMLRDMILFHFGPDGTPIDHDGVHKITTDLLVLCGGSRRLALLTPVILSVDKDDLETFCVERSLWFRRRRNILEHATETNKNRKDEDSESVYFRSVTPKVCQRCHSIPLATRIAVHGWKKCALDEKEGLSLFILRNWIYFKMRLSH